MTELRAPFPYFGGKARVAETVWSAFDPNVPNYVEPFYGTGAVLLGRPGGAGKIETINDLDCDVANFWRAITVDAAAVALAADWPVNEADLHALNGRLIATRPEHRQRMHTDPDHFDAKRAGQWAWVMSTAIAGNAMSLKGAGATPRICGWVRGNGMHALPAVGTSGRGLHSLEAGALIEWFEALRDRLRRTRVCCGDWNRVLTGAVTGESNSLKNMGMSPCAVFLDPPYGAGSERPAGCYSEDSMDVAAEVRVWAIEHGDDPHFRIALCGYDGEHVMPANWVEHAWKAQGGHGNRAAKNKNRHRERIYFSPHCLMIGQQQSLFSIGS